MFSLWSGFIISAIAKLVFLNQIYLFEQPQITVYSGQADAGRSLASLLVNLIGVQVFSNMLKYFPY
jgi:hypothetical protein